MSVHINNKTFPAEYLSSPDDIQKGMMGREFDKTFDGMLFLMSDEDHSFWMKNCITNLDIIFIKNNVISKIHHNCKPCKTSKCEYYKGYGDMVLELPGNSCKKLNINEGDQVLI